MNALIQTVARLLGGAFLTLSLLFVSGPSADGSVSPARSTASKSVGTPIAPRPIAPIATPVKHERVEIASLKRVFFRERSSAIFERLNQEEKRVFTSFYNRAQSDEEKFYLDRALAAGNAVRDIEAFAAQIRGKSDDWLRNMLRLTSSTRWYGIRQQWRDSCAPATVMALLGEIDPIFSLRVHRDNPNFYSIDDFDARRFNPKLASEQKRLLETTVGGETGGKAVARKESGGSGRWYGELLNSYSEKTGLRYTFKTIGPGYTMEEALKDMETALTKRIPVPLVVKAKSSTHAVLATALWKDGSSKGFNIHEPWAGRTLSRTHDQFRGATLDLAGNDRLLGVYVPVIDKL